MKGKGCVRKGIGVQCFLTLKGRDVKFKEKHYLQLKAVVVLSALVAVVVIPKKAPQLPRIVRSDIRL